jgi:hypothetical protein
MEVMVPEPVGDGEEAAAAPSTGLPKRVNRHALKYQQQQKEKASRIAGSGIRSVTYNKLNVVPSPFRGAAGTQPAAVSAAKPKPPAAKPITIILDDDDDEPAADGSKNKQDISQEALALLDEQLI